MLVNEIFNLWPSRLSHKTPKYDDSNVKLKAGILPFYKHDTGIIEFLFMVSSNPKFGGPDPMISKGGVDLGESAQQAAIREGKEELGLKQSNISSPLSIIYDQQITGLDNSYHMTFFTCAVKNKHDFGPYHYETAYTKWMTNEEFQQHGRKAHRVVVQRAYNLLLGNHTL